MPTQAPQSRALNALARRKLLGGTTGWARDETHACPIQSERSDGRARQVKAQVDGLVSDGSPRRDLPVLDLPRVQPWSTARSRPIG